MDLNGFSQLVGQNNSFKIQFQNNAVSVKSEIRKLSIYSYSKSCRALVLY